MIFLRLQAHSLIKVQNMNRGWASKIFSFEFFKNYPLCLWGWWAAACSCPSKK